jgi:protein TonB
MNGPRVYPRPRSILRPTVGILLTSTALAALTVSVLPFFQVLSAEQHEMLAIRTAPEIVYLPPPEEPIQELPPPEEEPEERPRLRTPIAPKPTPTAPRVEAPRLTASLPMSGIAVQVGDLDADLDYRVCAPSAAPAAAARPQTAPKRPPAAADTDPVALLTPDPFYPDRARRAGIQGYVELLILVSETGEVDEVRIVESEPRGMFDDVCRRAVKRWKFRPATRDGQPAPGSVRQRIRFELR